jgi:Pectate lyase superfamily protein
LTQPANTLSIATYGAVPNNSSVDNTSAIQNCMNAAQSDGMGVWIPSGTYYVTSGTVLNATGITISGAGPWYSTILDTSNSWSNGFLFLATSASFQNLCIDATQPDATPGLFAILGYGNNWTLNNVWARHTMLTWADGSNVTVENCRVNNSWGDGLNINNVGGAACNNILVMNNFARGNGDDGITLNSSDQNAPVMTNCTYKNNTSVASWWANEMGIYGP